MGLELTEKETEIIKKSNIGTLPPLNLGKKNMVLFQFSNSNEYAIYFIDEDRFESFTNLSILNYLVTLGFHKKYFKDLAILVAKKVFELNKPKWYLEKNMWHYNEYSKSAHSMVFQFYRDYGKDKGIELNAKKELNLPPLHKELFYNVCGDVLGVEYMAIKFKEMMTSPKKASTYTILRGIGGTGKSLLINYLSHLVGVEYSRIININDFKNNFNGMLKNAIVVFVEELPKKEKQANEFLSSLKEFVGNDRISIREKYKSYEEVINYTNFFITTNHFNLFDTMGERRHCEVVSSDCKLDDRVGFKELTENGRDFLQELLKETPLFFKALLEWNNKGVAYNSKFVSKKIHDLKAIRTSANDNSMQIIKEILKGDLMAFISACGDDISALSLAKHYDRENGKFLIPLAVAKENFLLMDNIEILKDNEIITNLS